MQIHSEANTLHHVTKRPAFRGAAYDRSGFCLEHPFLQIRRPIYIDGKVRLIVNVDLPRFARF